MPLNVNDLFKQNANPGMSRSEDELRMLATAFMVSLQGMGLRPQANYTPYDPGIDAGRFSRAALPATLDMHFFDPRGKTHIVNFNGDDARHAHFRDRKAGVDHWEQPEYLFHKGTLPDILAYLQEMSASWPRQQKTRMPA